MTRVLSALVLLPLVLGVVWFMPPVALLALAEVVLVIAFIEFTALADRLDVRIPRIVGGVGVCATCAALGWPGANLEGTLMTVTLAVGLVALGSGRPGAAALHDASGALFACLYLGLPLGALAATGVAWGREAVLLLILTTAVSDTAQYYGGVWLGRRLLAPGVSPKKTIEGAVSGLLAGTAVLAALGRAWLPGLSLSSLIVLGAAVVALGIAGDLFESLLKRSAGLKDTSGLIPGHGGMLDRIDSLLFAAPVFHVYLRYASGG